MSSSRDAGPGLSDSSALFGSFSRFQLLDDSPKKKEEKPNGQEEEHRIAPAEGTHVAGSEPRRRKKRSKSTRLALLDADNQDIGNDTEALADVSHNFTSLLLEPDAYAGRVGVIEVDGLVRTAPSLAAPPLSVDAVHCPCHAR